MICVLVKLPLPAKSHSLLGNVYSYRYACVRDKGMSLWLKNISNISNGDVFTQRTAFVLITTTIYILFGFFLH